MTTAPPNAVAAILRRDDGRFLLVRRAAGRPAPGYWSPITGRPLAGEPLERTVEREVAEEVGLAVRAVSVVHRTTTDDGRWHLVWFAVEPLQPGGLTQPLVLADDEVAEARWLARDEIERLEPMFASTRAWFRSES